MIRYKQYSLLSFHAFISIAVCLIIPVFAGADEYQKYFDMSLQELMSIPITSVSKKTQDLSDSPAAIFVITNKDIIRSGVTSIPEALRMAPGINVGRIDSNKWAVSSRGFNNRFTKKLLVLIDGRSVYTPGFSGVYWEEQDVLLEDVDRIEVIRGPGGSVWGANAVNGVINIITKHAEETQGALVTAGGGTLEQSFASARYGTALGEETFGRVYAKYFDRNTFEYETGEDAGDDWSSMRTGFRVDSKLSGPTNLTIQGDLYFADINQNAFDVPLDSAPYSTDVADDVDSSGGNLLYRQQHSFSESSEFTFQAYYDWTHRDDYYVYEKRDSFDIELQHRFSPLDRHDFIWGAGYRYMSDDMTTRYVLDFDPTSSTTDLVSGFIQDEIALIQDTLWFTLGTKVEHNDYTGFEVQPSGRILWSLHPEHKIWSAISRAVRTPSRGEREGSLNVAMLPPPSPTVPLPIAIFIKGDDSYESEDLTAYEVGYRFIPANDFSLDIAFFHNDYDNLQQYVQLDSVITQNYIEQTLQYVNLGDCAVNGFEVAVAYQPVPWLKTDLAYSFLDSDAEQPGMPKNQLSLRTSFDLSESVDMDLWFRYVDDVKAARSANGGLTFYEIDAYFTLDIRLAWQLNENLELSVVGQNLLDDNHLEFTQEAFIAPTEVPRSVYAQLRYTY